MYKESVRRLKELQKMGLDVEVRADDVWISDTGALSINSYGRIKTLGDAQASLKSLNEEFLKLVGD